MKLGRPRIKKDEKQSLISAGEYVGILQPFFLLSLSLFSFFSSSLSFCPYLFGITLYEKLKVIADINMFWRQQCFLFSTEINQ
jgi:hypothetical protein